MEQAKGKPAFGVGVRRFLDLGYHPMLEVRSGTYKYSHLGPGCYEFRRPRKITSKIPRICVVTSTGEALRLALFKAHLPKAHSAGIKTSASVVYLLFYLVAITCPDGYSFPFIGLEGQVIFSFCDESSRTSLLAAMQSKSLRPGWQRALEVEEYSRQLGYRNENVLKTRMYMQTVNGPAWHEFPPTAPEKAVKFSKKERYPVPKAKSFAVPGPGTYGKNHNPYTRYEEKSRSKGYSHSVLPSFDHYSRKPRSLIVQVPYSLPPNLYNIKGSVDELISKRTSKKGPYQLFSGARFPDPPPQKLSILKHPLYFSDLNNPCNSFKGKFSKYGRDDVKTFRLALTSLVAADESFPAPGYYNPYPSKQITQTRAPFNSGKDPRPSIKCMLHPPPGRYEQHLKKRILGDGMRSAFISKTQRKIFKCAKVSWFE